MVSCLACSILSEITLLLFCDVIKVYSYEELKFWRQPAPTSFRRRPENQTINKEKNDFRSASVKQNKDPLKIHLRSQRQLRNGDRLHYSDDEWYDMDPYSIYSQMQKLIPKFPNANISIEVIGRTVEYNDLVLLKVTENKDVKRFRSFNEAKYVKEEHNKKIIFIVHGLSIKGFYHVPALSEMPQLYRLLSYYFAHLDKFDIFLIPMANPDGLTIIMKEMINESGFWDKNVSPQSACPGVALDRNFNIAWNSGNTLSSCSQLYPGFVPFSEVETQVIRNIFHFYHHKIIAYINVKAGSYTKKTFKGEAVLYPKGYTDVQDDDDLYLDLKGEVEETIRNISFRRMSVTVDTLQSWYGIINGSSVDYASTVYGVPFALEFVMQSYDTTFNYTVFETQPTVDPLNVIWGKIINTVFNNIWKSTQLADRRL